jgi:integrase
VRRRLGCGAAAVRRVEQGRPPQRRPAVRKAVWRLVRVAAEDAGLEGWARFSGHSLRAGLATAAGEAGADLAQVMRQTRHRSSEVAMGYLRPAEIWRQNLPN